MNEQGLPADRMVLATLIALMLGACGSPARSVDQSDVQPSAREGIQGQLLTGPVSGSAIRAAYVAEGAFLKDQLGHGTHRTARDILLTVFKQNGRFIVSVSIKNPVNVAERSTWDYVIDPTSYRVLATDIENPKK
jgi:hypothetical protein